MGISVKYDSASKRAKSVWKVEKQGKKNGGSGETRTHNQRLKRPLMLNLYVIMAQLLTLFKNESEKFNPTITPRFFTFRAVPMRSRTLCTVRNCRKLWRWIYPDHQRGISRTDDCRGQRKWRSPISSTTWTLSSCCSRPCTTLSDWRLFAATVKTTWKLRSTGWRFRWDGEN